jgi:hypothetical protein
LRPATAVVAAGLLFAAMAKQHARDWSAWAGSAAVLAVAISCALYSKRLRVVSPLVAIAASGLFAIAMGGAGDLAPHLGMKCALIELCAAALPYVALAYTVVRRRMAADTAMFAAVAAAGALAGHAALNVTCPARASGPHLLVFHAGAVVLAAILGAIGSSPVRRWAQLRAG